MSIHVTYSKQFTYTYSNFNRDQRKHVHLASHENCVTTGKIRIALNKLDIVNDSSYQMQQVTKLLNESLSYRTKVK